MKHAKHMPKGKHMKGMPPKAHKPKGKAKARR